MSLRTTISASLLLLVMSACAAPPRAEPTGERLMDPATGQAVRGEARALELLPETEHSGLYTIEANGERARHEFTYQRTDDGWSLRIADRSQMFLRPSSDGGIELVAEKDFQNDVLVEYDPPLVVLPGRAGDEAMQRRESQVSITKLSDGSPRASGTVTQQISDVWRQSVRTPAGEFNALVVREKRHMDLNVADVAITIITAFAPGEGMVARQVHREQKTLGLFTKTTDEQLMRAD